MSPSQNLGRLLLRLTIAGLLGMYGIYKITDGGEPLQMISGWLAAKDLPTSLCFGVYLCEVLAPIMLIAGLMTRLAGLTVALHMGMAFYLAHSGQLGMLNEHGGWLVERPASFLVGGLAIALLGPGAYSVDARLRHT